MRIASISFCFAALLGCVLVSAAQAAATTEPVKIRWSGQDMQGRAVQIPSPGHAMVVALLRVGQPLSVDALNQIRKATETTGSAHCVSVFSGSASDDPIKAFIAEQKIDWPVISDRDYALAGKLSVNAWPTTVVVGSDGTPLAHLAGLSPNFALDLAAHLEFANGKIDQPTLAQKLASAQTVGEAPKQQIARLISLAGSLLDRGDVAGARAQIERGMKIDAADVDLKTALARVQIQTNQPGDALATLAAADGQVPAWQLGLLRGQALIALNRWDDARVALKGAAELNPHPASAYYYQGVVYRRDNDLARAADAFQKAYEATQRDVRPR